MVLCMMTGAAVIVCNLLAQAISARTTRASPERRQHMDDFTLVGARPSAPQPAKKQPWYRGLPLGAMLVLAVIILGCLSCGLFLPRDPTYMDLANCNVAPCREFLFGTDAMGATSSR